MPSDRENSQRQQVPDYITFLLIDPVPSFPPPTHSGGGAEQSISSEARSCFPKRWPVIREGGFEEGCERIGPGGQGARDGHAREHCQRSQRPPDRRSGMDGPMSVLRQARPPNTAVVLSSAGGWAANQISVRKFGHKIHHFKDLIKLFPIFSTPFPQFSDC